MNDLRQDPGARELYCSLVIPVLVAERFIDAAPPDDAGVDELERLVDLHLSGARYNAERDRPTPQQKALLDAHRAAEARAFPKARPTRHAGPWPIDRARAFFSAFIANYPAETAALPLAVRLGIEELLPGLIEQQTDAHDAANVALATAARETFFDLAEAIPDVANEVIQADLSLLDGVRRMEEPEHPHGAPVTIHNIAERARAGAA